MKRSLESSFSLILEKYLIEWNEKIDSKIDVLRKEVAKINDLIEKNNDLLKPLVTILVASKSLDEKTKKLAIEEEKLKSITLEEEKLLKLKGSYQSLISEISINHSKFYEEL